MALQRSCPASIELDDPRHKSAADYLMRHAYADLMESAQNHAALGSKNAMSLGCLSSMGQDVAVPASLSSGLASSLMGGSGDGLYSCRTLVLSGEKDKFGSGGMSTRSMISCGGVMYPVAGLSTAVGSSARRARTEAEHELHRSSWKTMHCFLLS